MSKAKQTSKRIAKVKVRSTPIPEGGITSAGGFCAAGIHAGFKKKHDLLDLAVVVSEKPCAAAGVFTQNIFCAAPVIVSRAHLGARSCGVTQAIVVNAGNANAATGKPGLASARAVAALAASCIGCRTEEVLVASTGVIGVPLPPCFEEGIPSVVQKATRCGGSEAAQAIMTTDTRPKEYALSYVSKDPLYEGIEFKVGGMAKGSGMIMPDMATLIAVLTTDAPLAPAELHQALTSAVGASFNKVSIDSDTSTNDSCFLMASGTPEGQEKELIPFAPDSLAFAEFATVLGALCDELAREIARDGEGATKLITVQVKGARTEEDADKAARAIANSPLVKTAIFGHDANWGRVAMAIGKSGAQFQQEDVSINFAGVCVCQKGLPVECNEDAMLQRFEEAEITIEVDLGAGSAETILWTCDLSHDYVTINGDYRT